AASLAGDTPAPELAPYAAAMWGVVGLPHTVHVELAGRGIHFSAICPGIINTNIVATSTMRGDAAAKRGKMTDFFDTRGVSPDEVAQAVLRAIDKRLLIVPVPRR